MKNSVHKHLVYYLSLGMLLVLVLLGIFPRSISSSDRSFASWDYDQLWLVLLALSDGNLTFLFVSDYQSYWTDSIGQSNV